MLVPPSSKGDEEIDLLQQWEPNVESAFAYLDSSMCAVISNGIVGNRPVLLRDIEQ